MAWPTFQVINVFGVVFLQVGLGLGIYLFDALQFAERFSNILTLFLTIVAFRIVLTDKLPKVAYLTIADQYMLSAFAQYTFTAASCAYFFHTKNCLLSEMMQSLFFFLPFTCLHRDQPHTNMHLYDFQSRFRHHCKIL